MSDIDARIRDALRALADDVREQDLRPEAAPTASTVAGNHRTIRWAAPLLAAAVVAAVVVTTVALSGSPKANRDVRPGGPGSPSSTLAPTAAPTATTHTTAPTPVSTTVQASRATEHTGCFFIDACSNPPLNATYYEPLWPFASYAQAAQWEQVDRRNGHSPWHADAQATALSFTQGYLGFTDIDTVTSTAVVGDEAHIGVGYRDANGTTHTSAVLHLVRYTTDTGDTVAGWEVVGSDDTDFSIEQPSYGSAVRSPVTAGGHITGTDESITVSIRTLGGGAQSVPPVAAGGDNSPWSVRAPFTGSGVLTIVAVTGGHLQQHERFSIQGVHTG